MEDSHSTGQQQQEPPTNQQEQNPETQQQQQQQQHHQQQQLKQIIHPTQSLPPPLRTIRRSFELLSVSYFLNIFAPLLSIPDFTISQLEADLDGSQPDSYLPSLIPKLLVSLTGDRTTNSSNWESRLRREFIKREPQANPLGEEPAKPKPKINKRAVGYVYIAEAIPLSTLPAIDDLNSQYAELTKSKNGTCHQVPANGQTPTDPSYPQDAPEIKPTPSDLPDTKPSNTTEQSSSLELPTSNQVDTKSSESLLADSNPSIQPPPEGLSRQTEPPESKPLTALSSENSSPAPQHPAGPIAIPWSSLLPTIKLNAIFKLCEWHFSTSTDLERFRRQVLAKANSPNTAGLDERFEWRQERCGIDSKGNQYWLSGQGIESRLWVQRREPQPPLKAITLRIPAREKKKPKNGQSKQQKRKHVTRTSSTTPSTPATNPSRRCSSGVLPDAKRPRLTGTRSSQRLRATQPESSNRSASPRPPTMIVIKKTGVPHNSNTPEIKKQGVNGSRRPISRRRANNEIWQDVPAGWLEEVVQPTSKKSSTVLSSDLSEMSDDDEFVGNTRQSNQTKPNPPPTKTKHLPAAPDNASVDESLSELSDSPDASTVVTCESLSDDSSGGAASVDVKPDVKRAIEKRDVQHKDSSREQKMNVATTEVDAAPVTDCQDQKSTDLPVSNIHQSSSDDSATSNVLLNPPEPAKSILVSTHDPSSELTTPESNIQTSEVVPNVDSGNLSSCDAEKVKPCLDGSDSLFPELKGHPLDPDWIEWEVVCAELNDWKNFSLQFQNTESQSEKQLVEFIDNEVLPQVIAAHNEEEARKQKEEAMAQRKRSSRLATREAVQANSMQVEMMTRETRMHSDRLEAKRLKEVEHEESKKKKEEDQRLIRLRERQEQIALREAQQASEREAELKRAERARQRAESKLQGKAVKVARAGAENSVPSIDETEKWELNCEICGVIGSNMDDGSEVICCDNCEIWQHLVCHDKADEIMKRAKRNWATADFICADCSGVPIPRAVKKLRTHINGKPKPPPRPRTSKPKDELNHSVPSTSGPSNTKSKITILMSNPSRLGGTTLNEVSPANANPASSSNLAPCLTQLQDVNSSGESTLSRSNGNIANQVPSNATMPRPTPLPPSLLPSVKPPVTTRPTTTQPDLTKYYDDLEKLCCILRTNTNLHRTLPIEVMHRLRRYLLDQQQGQHLFNRTHPTSGSTNPGGMFSNHSNVHPSLKSQSGLSTYSPQSTPSELQQRLHSSHLDLVARVDPQTIDPQLQQLANRPEPLDTNMPPNANPDANMTTTATTTTVTTGVANRNDDHPDSVMSDSFPHTVASSIPPAQRSPPPP
ncbi:hypothetical protein PGT21_015506 [Puccinia graminis f. sp. tritici]|uniref:Zinc finger PHD-type domain-containing protein n=1 Tax=Puccinia graminis f. sp. tritici TaxID=56615 RepID=A0A5B0R269_PUCGR|nr:hypothetical protein PGT21_015506 [Puccinia graminis f. sp. tritici]